jgi:hypothetical protein
VGTVFAPDNTNKTLQHIYATFGGGVIDGDSFSVDRSAIFDDSSLSCARSHSYSSKGEVSSTHIYTVCLRRMCDADLFTIIIIIIWSDVVICKTVSASDHSHYSNNRFILMHILPVIILSFILCDAIDHRNLLVLI